MMALHWLRAVVERLPHRPPPDACAVRQAAFKALFPFVTNAADQHGSQAVADACAVLCRLLQVEAALEHAALARTADPRHGGEPLPSHTEEIP